MAFPVVDRFKNLQEIVAGMGVEPYGSHPFQPSQIPGIVVDFITRSDGGQCLKVVPFCIKSVTASGEVTFDDGANLIPSTINYYVPVYPIDVPPAQVSASFTLGRPILFFPYWAPGINADKVRGTYVCTTGASLPAPEFIGQEFVCVAQNRAGWTLDRFIPIVTN